MTAQTSLLEPEWNPAERHAVAILSALEWTVGAQVKQGRGWSVSMLFCGATYYVRRANLLTFTREQVRNALNTREEAAQA